MREVVVGVRVLLSSDDRRCGCRRFFVALRGVAPELGPGTGDAGQADRPGAGIEEEPGAGGSRVPDDGEDKLLVHGSQYVQGV